MDLKKEKKLWDRFWQMALIIQTNKLVHLSMGFSSPHLTTLWGLARDEHSSLFVYGIKEHKREKKRFCEISIPGREFGMNVRGKRKSVK
jgi:hypothetical protein